MWRKGLCYISNIDKSAKKFSQFGALLDNSVRICRRAVLNDAKVLALCCFQPLGRNGLDYMSTYSKESLIVAKNALGISTLPGSYEGKFKVAKQSMMAISRQFGHDVDPKLDRDFFVQLWLVDKKLESFRGKRKRKTTKDGNFGDAIYDNNSSVQTPFGRFISNESVVEEKPVHGKRALQQPPVSQSMTGLLKPSSAEEARVAPLLARSNLLITRDIEWANLMLGFEQENRYAIVDVCYPQLAVGFIREQSNLIARQVLRLRRPFVACVTDAMDEELFRVRRPFWWITSSIYVEINGKEIGVVHRRWHLWRRIYDLYLGDKQFAVVENPGLWNWTFTLKDIDGEVLAQIDRDWRGFGFEIFTDAGQYVIRFGNADSSYNTGPGGVIQELDVKRPLTLAERAITVALAISLDNDYFSRHGGWGLPFLAVTE